MKKMIIKFLLYLALGMIMVQFFAFVLPNTNVMPLTVIFIALWVAEIARRQNGYLIKIYAIAVMVLSFIPLFYWSKELLSLSTNLAITDASLTMIFLLTGAVIASWEID